jgi:hypothetical protein
MLLSDVGNWASIIGFVLSLVAGFSLCKITTKTNNQKNKYWSLFTFGDTKQENNSSQ